MAVTYTLGKDYTVSGLSGTADLTVTFAAERVDITTRDGAKPFKMTVDGLHNTTFEGSVLATETTSFVIGDSYDLTVGGSSLGSLVCMTANREESQDGIVTYKLTLRPGLESTAANQITVGPGDYRA